MEMESSVTRSIVVFLGPLPGSSKTKPFCGVYSVIGKAREGKVLELLVREGAYDHHSAIAQEDIAPSWFLIQPGGERAVRVPRLTLVLASSELQWQFQQIRGLFSSRTHLFPF